MDEDQWMYDSMMSQEVEMNDENEKDVGVKVDCSDALDGIKGMFPVAIAMVEIENKDSWT